MCLQAQGIDDDDGVVNRVIRAHEISNDGGGVGRGRGIDDASEELETTTKAMRIKGRRPRLRRCNDWTAELATTTKELAEEDEPEVLTTTMEASDEEAKYKTRPSEHLQRWRH